MRYQGSHSLAYKNFQDFPGPQNDFPLLRHSPAMMNYRQTAVTYSVYTVWQYNPS